MTSLKLRKWGSADHLKTGEDMALYLEACRQEAEDDTAFIAKVLDTIDRAKATAQRSRNINLSRDSGKHAL